MKGPVYLVGPTASGKSAVALALAPLIDGEIVSVDSVQVYQGLDIGSAKPTRDEQERIPHHLLDVSAVRERFDAARFVTLAREAVASIRKRGKTPIFCGGTGLYLHAYLHGLGEAPAGDARLRQELASFSLDEQLEQLRRLDPESFERIDRRNPRRVERALEVVLLTGKPFSESRADWASSREQGPLFYGIAWDKELLWRRIESRAETMMSAGLVEETRAAIAEGLLENLSAAHAIGYRQAIEFLEGRWKHPELIEEIVLRTRQFAKRQMTWFRGKANVAWTRPENEGDLMKLALDLERSIQG